MKQSINRQITIIFILFMSGLLLAFWSINNIFLVKYYEARKQDALKDVYKILSEYYSQDVAYRRSENDWVNMEIKKIAAKENMTIYVQLANGQSLVEYRTDESKDFYYEKISQYIFEVYDENVKILETDKKNGYTLTQTTDAQLKTEYIEMYGTIPMDMEMLSFILRTPLESIRETANSSNRFFSFITVAAFGISIFIISFLSKHITKPVKELVGISERMIQLDFDAKYQSGGENEIGILGRNFNQMSEKLEYTISELKTANNELHRDIRQKEKLEEMRIEFLSNVSHELKTPIALIQGYAEGLKEGVAEDPENMDFYCDVIMDEASKMNKMVKQLLALNQLESDNSVSMERFDIVSLIHGILQSNNLMAQQKDAVIYFDETDPVYVWADEFKTEQVFSNYISNAFHHLDGERIICVELEPGDDKIRINVFNTGELIPEEDIPHIWDKFYKVDKARTREYGGHGIGLSIVKAIMDSFDKECGVENRENGVVFWFELDSKL